MRRELRLWLNIKEGKSRVKALSDLLMCLHPWIVWLLRSKLNALFVMTCAIVAFTPGFNPLVIFEAICISIQIFVKKTAKVSGYGHEPWLIHLYHCTLTQLDSFQGQEWSAIPSALLSTFWNTEICRAGHKVFLTIFGPGPSFSIF